VQIFDHFVDPGYGLDFVFRWLHVLCGIAWIGLLYYFNFVQTPAFAELSPAARNEAFDKLAWRALWWFRWAAMGTFVLGIGLIGILSSKDVYPGQGYFGSSRGTALLTGALFGITMAANVWMVIWPNQKIVIGSVRKVIAGGEADPAQPAAAKTAARASRANVFFSVAMLWFMLFAPHFSGFFGITTNHTGIYFVLVLLLWAFVELSALGKIGGYDSPFNKLVFDDHKKTIIFAFVNWAVIYFVGWELIMKP
jgi:uncharacterized membrane protein